MGSGLKKKIKIKRRAVAIALIQIFSLKQTYSRNSLIDTPRGLFRSDSTACQVDSVNCYRWTFSLVNRAQSVVHFYM